MPVERSLGFRAAIGFLTVVGAFGLMWFWFAVLSVASGCIGALTGAQRSAGFDGQEGWRQLGILSLKILAATLGYAVRHGAGVMVRYLESQGASPRVGWAVQFKNLAWGTASCGLGLASGALICLAITSHYFIRAGESAEALQVTRQASLVGGIVSIGLLVWGMLLQKRKVVRSSR